MKLSRAAAALVASACAAGAFVPSVRRAAVMAPSSSHRAAPLMRPLGMSEVLDAETVEEGAETFE